VEENADAAKEALPDGNLQVADREVEADDTAALEVASDDANFSILSFIYSISLLSSLSELCP